MWIGILGTMENQDALPSSGLQGYGLVKTQMHYLMIFIYSKSIFLLRSSSENTVLCCLQGRVKKVSENYTKNFTVPTNGFDCHMSEGFLEVSATTSSFLAFERTQVCGRRANDGQTLVRKMSEYTVSSCGCTTVNIFPYFLSSLLSICECYKYLSGGKSIS